jgi:lipoate-protein ligase A
MIDEVVVTEWRVLKLEKRHPFEIAAMEELLLNGVDRKTIPNTIVFHEWCPAVSISKNQPLSDVNVEKCRKDGVHVVRTLVGGRAVYHDPEHSMSFCVAMNTEGLPSKNETVLFRACLERITAGFRNLGIPAEIIDQNYIRADGKKISGTAMHTSPNAVVFHGSILYDVPDSSAYAEKMLSFMKLNGHPKDKIKDDIVKSLSHVRAFAPSVSRQDVCFSLAKEFSNGETKYGSLSDYELSELKRLVDEKYSRPDWRKGGSERGLCWRPYGPVSLSETRGENPS